MGTLANEFIHTKLQTFSHLAL